MQPIEVVYEKGVLRPLGPVPGDIQEHQRLTVTIEGVVGHWSWVHSPGPVTDLEIVRPLLATVPGTFAQAVHDEREER